MWVYPSRGRPAACQALLDSMVAHGSTAGGVLYVHEDDESYDGYASLRLPAGWFLRQVRSGVVGCAQGLRRAFRTDPDEPWYGWIADDNTVETDGFEQRLIAAAGPWGIASANDGWQAPKRMHGATVFGGEFLRALGYWVPEGFQHLYIDDVWGHLGRQLGNWRTLMDVHTPHNHPLKTGAEPDATHRLGNAPERYAADGVRFKEWLAEDFEPSVRRVLAAMKAVAPKAFDCFLYAGEQDVLDIRFAEMADTVDYFVVVEATKTFSGKPRELAFDAERYSHLVDRLVYVVVDDMPEGDDPWVRECHQRNAILRGLTDAGPDDVVLISDADEVIRADVIEEMKTDVQVGAWALQMPTSYCKLNYINTKGHPLTAWSMACRAQYLTSPEGLRMLRGVSPELPEHASFKTYHHAGWHFSFLGDADAARAKIAAYSHQEFAGVHLDTPATIRKGADLLGRPGFEWSVVKLNEYFPAYVLENRERFAHLIADGAVKHIEAQPNDVMHLGEWWTEADFAAQGLDLRVAQSRSLFIGVPAYQDVHPACALFLANAIRLLTSLGIPCDLQFAPGMPVHQARNHLVNCFMMTGLSHLLMVDADMSGNPWDVVRLLAAPHLQVAGVGRKRNGLPDSDPKVWCFVPGDLTPDRYGMLQVPQVGTGFIRIAREVFNHTAANADALGIWRWANTERTERYLQYFSWGVEDGDELSEDITWCRQCSRIGIPTYVDTRVELSHYGVREHRARLADHLPRH